MFEWLIISSYHFVVLVFDLTYASGQNETCFVKIEARVLGLWLDETFGPKLPKSSFQAPNPKCYGFGIKTFSHIKLHKIVHKIRLYLQNLADFLQIHERLFIPRKLKKNQLFMVPLTLVYKKPLFGARKFKMSGTP